MRVVHVVRQFHPAIGGLEDMVLNLARTQREACGIDASVVTLDRVFTDAATVLPQAATVQGIAVTRLPWRGSTRYPLAPGVLARLGQADIVHVHGIDFFFDFLALTRPLHRRRLVASTHGGFFHTAYRQRLKRLWFASVTRLAARAYDAIVAVSAADAAMFAPIAGRRLVTIENGVNLAKFPPRPGVARDPRRILAFGRFARHKRIDRVVALLAELRRREPGWSLVLAGAPGDHPVAELQAAAAAAGVADAVRILVAPDDDALAGEVAQARWFCSASAYEGFGIAAVEAAAAGLIPVLSDIPPFARLQAQLGAGLLFDPADAAGAAERVIGAGGQRDGADGGRQRAAAVAGFGWDAAAAEHARLYWAVLLPPSARREAIAQCA